MINRKESRPSSGVHSHSRLINFSPSNNRSNLKPEPFPSRPSRQPSHIGSVNVVSKQSKLHVESRNNFSQQYLSNSLKNQSPTLHFHYLNHESNNEKKISTSKASIDKDFEEKYQLLKDSLKKMYEIWEAIYQEHQELEGEKKESGELIPAQERNLRSSLQYKQLENLFIQCLDSAVRGPTQTNSQTPRTQHIEYKKQHEEYLKQIKNLQNENITVIAELNRLKDTFKKMQKKQQEYQDHIKELSQIINTKYDELVAKGSTLQELSEKNLHLNEEIRKKQKRIRELENDLKTVKNIEKECQEKIALKETEYVNEMELVYQKMKQKQQQIEEIKETFSRKQSTSQIQNHYKNKYSQLVNMEKQKEQKIKQLRETIIQQEKKISEISDHQISQKQLETLQKKIKEYENMLLTQCGTIQHKPSNETYEYFNGEIFQEKVIYQLKKDNDKLLKFVNQCRQFKKYNTQAVEQRAKITFQNQESQAIQKTIKLVEDALYKVERIIEKNQADVITKKAQSRPHSKEKTKKSRNSTHLVNSDLSILKIYLIEVNEYVRKVLNQFLYKQTKENTRKVETERQIRKIEPMKLTVEQQEDLTFYKNENNKLTARIDSLLDINSKLKDQLLKKFPESKPTNEINWKNQTQTMEEKIKSLQIKLNKYYGEINQLEDKLLQQQNKSTLYAAEIERLLYEQDKVKAQKKSCYEDKLQEYASAISQLTQQKENLKQELTHEGKKQREAEYRLTQLLRQIQDKNEKNKIMDKKIKEAEKLFTRFSELEIKLIDLSQGVSTQYGKQKSCTYMTKLTKDQLYGYIKEIHDLVQQIEDNKNSFSLKKMRLNSQLSLRILSELKSEEEKGNTNYKYLLELARGVALQTECLSEQLKVEGDRNRRIVEQIIKNNVMLLKEMEKN